MSKDTNIQFGQFPTEFTINIQGDGDGRIVYNMVNELVEETEENYEFNIEALKNNVTYTANQKSEGLVKQSIY